MYAVSISVEGDCYVCVPPDPGIEAAALGASESSDPGAGEFALSGTALAQVLHTFTLDSSDSRSFFRDRATLTPLSRPVAVSLADPSRGPVLAHYYTVLLCSAALSGSLSGLYLPSFSTNLVSGADLQNGGVDQFTLAGQRVTHCTCARTGRHLATFTHRPGSSLYTLTTESPLMAASGQVAASSQVFAAASRSGMASRVLVSGLPRSLPPLPPGPAPTCVPCVEGRLRAAPHSSEFPLTKAPLQTLHMDVWGPARVRGQGHERYFLLVVDDFSRYTSVFPLRRKDEVTEVLIDWIRVARLQLRERFGSDFPVLRLHSDRETRPLLVASRSASCGALQTLHMDVWGPARVRGQGHERYFLLVVDDFSRYTSVFPLRRKNEVTEVLIDWICVARLQLRERFGSDFPVLRLHSDRGGEFSSDLLRAFYRVEGIRQTFTLPASPQQNGIAERRIGMVMDVARTSMIHAAAPHFLWPFAVQYAVHQLNLQPRVSMLETSPTLRWTGKVGDAYAFRVWGSLTFVHDLSADELSSRAIPCVFLGFPPDASGWQFYHPTSRRVLSSQDVMFDESVPYYRLFPYRAAPLPPAPPLFLTPGPPPVDPLPPQGPAPSGVFHVYAVEPVQVAVDSGASRGAEPMGAVSGGAEPESAEPRGAGPGGAEPECAEPRGTGSGGAEPGVAECGGAEPDSAGPGGPSGALSRRAAGAGGAAGAVGSTATEGAGATGPGGARTGGTGAARPGGATGAGAIGGAGAGGAAGVGATGGSGARAVASSSGPAGAGAAGGTGAGGAAGAGAPVGAGVGAPGAAGGAPGAGGAAGVGVDAGGAGVVPACSGGAARPRPYFVLLLEQVLGLPPSSGPPPSLECPPPVQSESQLQLASPLPAPSPYAGPTGGLAERREPESRPASPIRAARTSRRVPRQRPPAVPGTHQMALRPSTAPQRVPLPSPPESSLPALADPESDSLRAASPTITRLLATVVTDPSFESTAASALVAKLVDFVAHCRLDYPAGLVAESKSVCPPSVGGECALGYSAVVTGSSWEAEIYAGAMAAHELRWLTYLLTDLGEPPRSPLANIADIFTKALQPCDHQRFCTMLACFALLCLTGPVTPYASAKVGAELHPLDYWVLDTGVAWTMTPRKELLDDVRAAPINEVCSTSRHVLKVAGAGRAAFKGADGKSVVLHDVLLVPDLKTNLISLHTGAMAAQELHWLTNLLTDLGEQPRSPPVLYVDNKAMIALCQEHRLEHRTKHIALRYFLARELQQRGQLRLAYMATRANTADIFTKALSPGDHKRFSTVLGLPALPLCGSLASLPTLPPRFASLCTIPLSPPNSAQTLTPLSPFPPPTPHFVVSSPRSSHPLPSPTAISLLPSPPHRPFLCHLLSTPLSHCAIPSTPTPLSFLSLSHRSSQGTARHRPATNAPFIFNIKTVGGMILLKVKFTDCFVEIARLVQQCKHNHFKDAALQAESESVLRLTHRDGKEWVVLSVGPSGKPSPWEGNCSDAIPATQISGQALIGALTSGVIPPPDNPSIPLSLPSLPYLRVEYVKVSQDSLGLAMAEGVATI
ncbi:unnamed protein product [Closterium sp. NIES-53]